MHHSADKSPARSGLVASRRTTILLSVVALLGVFSGSLGASVTPRLYVFATADKRAQAFEKHLEGQLPGVDVTVYSRIREFESALADRPEGAIAQRPVLEALGQRPELQGFAGERATERYVLMAANTPVQPSELSGKTLGVVDVLGRKRMEGFVSGILGTPAPKLKYVTHERDLLPLLQFNAADAVVLSESWARRVREKSEMNLRTTPLSNEVGLFAIVYGSSLGRSVLDGKIRAAGRAFNESLGVTQWR
jgi:hypothetical protein